MSGWSFSMKFLDSEKYFHQGCFFAIVLRYKFHVCEHFQKDDNQPEVIVDDTTVEKNSVNTVETPLEPIAPSPEPEDEDDDDDDDDDDFTKPSVMDGDNLTSLVASGGSTFDYLYEFSETRKVLEEFFKCPPPTEEKENNGDSFPFQVNIMSNQFII